jgi:phosphate transport system permease protein
MKQLGLLSLAIVFGLFGLVFLPMVQALPWVLDPSYLFGLPVDQGRLGGVAPMLHATVVVLLISVLVAVLLGLPVAFTLARGRSRWMRSALDILAGTPSIVFGLFGHALFVQTLGFGYSLLSGGLTLACMVLPFFIRVVEDAVRLIPKPYAVLATSLGFSEASRTMRIELPMVLPAVLTGIVLAWMRAAAETAALLFTAGYSLRSMDGLGLLDSGRPLAVHIFELSMNVAGADDMAWRAACLLMIVSFAFILLVRLAGRVSRLALVFSAPKRGLQ